MDLPSTVRRRSPRARGRRNPAASTRDKARAILLGALVFVSALAMGSALFWAAWVAAGIALIGGALSVRGYARLPRPALAMLGAALFTATQALPLPFHWVELLSPTAARTWERALLPFGAGPPRIASLSIDPGATVFESMKWLGYACAFLLASRVRARNGWSLLAAIALCSSASVAALTLLHGAGNFRAVYGIYHPTFEVARWSVGPLLNSNNLGGYVAVGLFAGAALLLHEQPRLPKAVVALCMSACAAALALSGSRGAILSTVLGTAALSVALWRSGQAWLNRGALSRAIPPVFAGLLVAVAAGSARNLDALTSADIERKIAVWSWSLSVIRDHFVFGVGRGAFEAALSPYRQPLAHDWSPSFAHAENFVLQWSTEWGAFVGGAMVVGAVSLLATAWWSNRSRPHRLALLTGASVILLQNVVDLGLELSGPFVLALVALVGGLPAPQLSPRGQHAESPVKLVPVVTLAGAWVLSAFVAHWPLDVERATIAESYEKLDIRQAPAREALRDALRSAMHRHPGEAYFPLVGALIAHRASDQNPLPWIARAVERAPVSGPVHLALSEIVGRQGGQEQAMLHLRLAATYDSTLLHAVGRRASLRAANVDVLLQAIPEGDRGDTVLLAACDAAPSLTLGLDCIRRGVQRAPRNAAMLRKQVALVLRALAEEADGCAEEQAEGCEHEVETAIGTLKSIAPNDWRSDYYRARLLIFRGKTVEATRLLANTCPPDGGGHECARDFVTAAMTAGVVDLRTQALDAFAARECATPNSCAAANDWLSSQLLERGEAGLALGRATLAAEAQPTARRWLGVAELALRQQRYAEARSAVLRASHAPDATPESAARGSAIESRVLRALTRTLR